MYVFYIILGDEDLTQLSSHKGLFCFSTPDTRFRHFQLTRASAVAYGASLTVLAITITYAGRILPSRVQGCRSKDATGGLISPR